MEPVALWGTRKVCLLSWSCYTYLIQVNILSMQTIKNIFINKHTRGSARHGRPFKDVGGFTIIELLVVIVIIAILAAISLVAYNGITTRASNASIQSDLVNASNVLRMYQVDNTKYPDSVTDCPTPSSTSNICLKLSSNNTASYNVNNSSTPQSYNLTIVNSQTNNLGLVSNDSKPLTPANTIAPLSPVADWLAIPSSDHYSGYTDHYGNFYDPISKSYATVTRSTPKTIYDPTTQHIYDVPANYLGIRPRTDNKSGFEAEIEEQRTNQALQSSFETDSNSDGIADNWADLSNYWTGTGSQAISSEKSVYGQKSFRMERTSSTGQLWSQPTTYMENGQAYVFSCYINGNSIDAGLDAYTGSSWVLARLQASQFNNWTKLSTPSFVFTGTTGTYGGGSEFRVTISGSHGPTVAYFDACQMEKGTFSTSYIPTTTAAATRNADVVTVPTTNWNAGSGTLMAVANYTNNAVTNVNQTDSLLGWGSSSSNMFNLFYQYGGARFASYAAGNWQNLPIGASYTYHTAVGSYSSVSNYLYSDEVKSTSSGSNLPTGLPSTASIGYGYVGYGNTLIQRAIVYSSQLSDTDVSTVTNAIKDGP